MNSLSVFHVSLDTLILACEQSPVCYVIYIYMNSAFEEALQETLSAESL